MLSKSDFIEFPEEFCFEYRTEEPSPVFRKHFTVSSGLKRATLSVCGLGYGYYYLNGEPVTADLFTAPTADYNKTLWYNVYDITKQLRPGDNLFAVILGNGFYNETLHTIWENNTASWRGLPKFALELSLEYENALETVKSDESWLCSKKSPVRFNQLRSGEVYDARIGELWRTPCYDDGDWICAVRAEKAPSGVFRECTCPPIRIDREYKAVKIFKNSVGNYVLDFGQNISGFVKADIDLPAGVEITLRCAERLKSDGTCEFNEMDSTTFYRDCEFQTDKIICGGERFVYMPRFTYHGFRYVEIIGLSKPPTSDEFTALFVHQDIKRISEFESSDETLNKLYEMGLMSSLSNLFYILTDCPTREKMGWTNDAQASCEQLLQNFDISSFLRKWLQDIFDAMRDDGALPGIIPTHGWGYEWGSGPISSGVIFEIVYMLFRYRGDREALKAAYPYLKKHLSYIYGKKDPTDGLIGYGLCDWAGPFPSSNHAPTPVKLSDTLLAIKFYRIAEYAATELGFSDDSEAFYEKEKELTSAFKIKYLDENGRCRVNEQTALAMIISLGVYDELSPLKEQLCEQIKLYDFHHHCGMLGMQYLFDALDICSLSDYGYRILTADGHPSYKQWITDGATTMYERWSNLESNNHHMFSCVLAWFNKTLVGLRLDDTENAFKKAVISPAFIESLDFCKGKYRTASGDYCVCWKREKDGIKLDVSVPENSTAILRLRGYGFSDKNKGERELNSGSYSFKVIGYEQCEK